MDYETEELCCMSCSTVLMEPYIRCVECSSTAEGDQVFLCLHCFAKGVEFTGHQSDHPYTVIVSTVQSLYICYVWGPYKYIISYSDF